MNWSAFLFFVIAALLGWWLYRTIKTQKNTFTKANFTKTLGTLGILAIILIVFVGLCIVLVKQS